MHPTTNELENTKRHIVGLRDKHIELFNFAIKHDMLGLFEQAKKAVDSFNCVIGLLEKELESRKPMK